VLPYGAPWRDAPTFLHAPDVSKPCIRCSRSGGLDRMVRKDPTRPVVVHSYSRREDWLGRRVRSGNTHFLIFLATATSFAFCVSAKAINVIIQHHGRRFDLLSPSRLVPRAGTRRWDWLWDGRLRQVNESWGCCNDGGGRHRRRRSAGHADLRKCGKCGDVRRFASWRFGLAFDGCKDE
jgi:hypothetical protein